MTPIFRICFAVLATHVFGPCDGVTLFVNSKYPPPPPFVTSLYRAPQTYDRGKSSRAPRPFIIISKVRPCYSLESARHFGLVKPGSLARPQLATPSPIKSNPLWSRPGTPQLPPSSGKGTSAQEFEGNWQIIKPVLKDDLDDRVIKYNKDGTRIVHEALYNYHTREPQIGIKDLKGVPHTEVKDPDGKHATPTFQSTVPITLSTAASVTQAAMAEANLPKITITAQYHVSSATTQRTSTSTVKYIIPATESATMPPISTTTTTSAVTGADEKVAHTLGPIAVASSYFVHDLSKIPEESKKSTKKERNNVTSTMMPVSVVTSYVMQSAPTSTEQPKKSLISKLGGGAQSIFSHIFGGFLSGRDKKDKNGDAVNLGNNTSTAWTEENTNPFNASFHHNSSVAIDDSDGRIPQHITKKLPLSFWTQLKFLQEQLEKINPKISSSKNGFAKNLTILSDATHTVHVTATEPVSSSFIPKNKDSTTTTSAYGFDFSSTPIDHLTTWPLEHSEKDQRRQGVTTPNYFPTEHDQIEEEEYSDFTPWLSSDEEETEVSDIPNSVTTLSSMLYGKMNMPTSCPDCGDLKNEEHENGELFTSTSGWRPLRGPVSYRPDPPRDPAPAPLSIHQWLHSNWNDSSDWQENGDYEMLSSTDFAPESTTETSVIKWFQNVATNNVTPHQPSETPNDFDVTTYRPLMGLSPIQWLFGGDSTRAYDSMNETEVVEMYADVPPAGFQDTDIETRAKEGQEILDVPISRVKPRKPGQKPSNPTLVGRESSSAQLLKHAQIINQSNIINTPQVRRQKPAKTNQSEFKLEPKRHEIKSLGEQIPSKNITRKISYDDIIKEMGKIYMKMKVGLGLPLPWDVIEPLITMKYESMTAKDRVNDTLVIQGDNNKTATN